MVFHVVHPETSGSRAKTIVGGILGGIAGIPMGAVLGWKLETRILDHFLFPANDPLGTADEQLGAAILLGLAGAVVGLVIGIWLGARLGRGRPTDRWVSMTRTRRLLLWGVPIGIVVLGLAFLVGATVNFGTNGCDPDNKRFEALQSEQVLQSNPAGTTRTFSHPAPASDDLNGGCHGPEISVVLDVEPETSIAAVSEYYTQTLKSSGWVLVENSFALTYKKPFGEWEATASLYCPAAGPNDCQIELRAPPAAPSE
jgi:hypothetical protein